MFITTAATKFPSKTLFTYRECTENRAYTKFEAPTTTNMHMCAVSILLFTSEHQKYEMPSLCLFVVFVFGEVFACIKIPIKCSLCDKIWFIRRNVKLFGDFSYCGSFNTRSNSREIHFHEIRIVWHFRMHSHCMDHKKTILRLEITSKIGICPRDAPWDMNKDPKFNVQIKSTDRKKWHLKFDWFANRKNYLFQVFVNPFRECFLLNCISFVCYASMFTNPARYVATLCDIRWNGHRTAKYAISGSSSNRSRQQQCVGKQLME